MLTHPTLEQLRALKLDGMLEAFAELQAQDAAADLSHAEWLGLLADRETATRDTRRFQTRMRAAILDRLVHNAYRLELEGQSMRRSSDPAKKVDEGHGA